jgi:hypothetical protein
MESVKREEPLKESERRGIIIGVLAAMLLAALDQTIVAPFSVWFGVPSIVWPARQP